MEAGNRILFSVTSTALFHCLLAMLLLNLLNEQFVEIPKSLEIYVTEIGEQIQQQASKIESKQIRQTEKLPPQIVPKPAQTIVKTNQPIALTSSAIATPITQPSKTAVENTSIAQPVSKKTIQTQSSQSERAESTQVAKYLGGVREKIQSELKYPIQAKRAGLEGETTVRFCIMPNGGFKESSLEIVKSSGNSMLDKNALAAVLDAVPFDVPPQSKMEIVIPVVFKINKG